MLENFRLHLLNCSYSECYYNQNLTISKSCKLRGLNKVEPPGTRWTQQRTKTKNKKFIGETERAITIAQQNTILAIAIVIKSTISVLYGWNHQERNGTSKQQTQKKTFIGQHCVKYHQLIEYNFANNYCHKELHLSCQQGVPDPTLLYMHNFIYVAKSQ